MRRHQQIILLIAILGLTFLAENNSACAGGRWSKVKVTATASKIAADGKQTVTVTLDIAKGMYVYANPVKFQFKGVDEEAFNTLQPSLGVTSAKPILTTIRFPEGKKKVDPDVDLSFMYYEGKVNIEAKVQRFKGNTDPLEITVRFMQANGIGCFPPSTVKMTVPEQIQK